jgi:hypothetical protein
VEIITTVKSFVARVLVDRVKPASQSTDYDTYSKERKKEENGANTIEELTHVT